MRTKLCKYFSGCGFIGRNFVEFLIDNDVASYIRVVDKLPPQVAWLNKRHSLAFKDPRVEHVSANLMYFGMYLPN